MASARQPIVGLIESAGTRRIYQMEDGSIETREGGSVSWRNNNPGNLKFVYHHSADRTVHSTRTKEEALAAAQKKYDGVVALDQWGNAIFATEAAGRAAQAKLLTRTHGDKTIEQMLPSYAIADYSGKANTKAYAGGIYAAGDRQGLDLRTKKIGVLSTEEMSVLQDAMKHIEGYRVGRVATTPPSFRQAEEKSMQKMTEQGLAPRAVVPLADALSANSNITGSPLFQDAFTRLCARNTESGIPSDQRTAQAAAAIAVAAAVKGLSRIDHLEPMPGEDTLIAVQGRPGSALSKTATLPMTQAFDTPVAASDRALSTHQAAHDPASSHNHRQHEQPLRP